MAADPTLLAEPRPRTGSAESRRLRSRGVVPGVVYGHGEGSVGIAVPAADLKPILQSGHQLVDLSLSGAAQKSIFKDVQYDTFGQHVLHFDLQRVSADEKIETTVRVVLHGVAVGTDEGGVMQQDLDTMEISCPADSIPDEIAVHIHDMQVGDEMRVEDLPRIEKVTFLTDPHDMVCQVIDAEVLAARQEAILDDAVETGGDTMVEPELVGEKDEPEEGDDDAPAKPKGEKKDED